MIINAVIFDLDGVLCYTDAIHYRAWKTVSEELSIPFNEKDNEQFRGVSRKDCFQILMKLYTGPPLTSEDDNHYIAKKNQLYCEQLTTLGPEALAVGVVDTLLKLRQAGILLAVGSSSKNAKMILQTLELTKYFDAVSDGNNIIRSKPDPEVFLYAAKELHTPPEKCLVVEDAQAGIIAAKRAGMHSAAIGGIAESGIADYSIKTLPDLLEIVRPTVGKNDSGRN